MWSDSMLSNRIVLRFRGTTSTVMVDADVLAGEGAEALSLADRLLLLLTIFLFLLLSAVSGRVLYSQYAAKRKRLISTTTAAETPGLLLQPKHHTRLYPKHLQPQ
ncbi:hypothetical protein GN244_ATG13283 [Phytophthora infestans]|uniref:Uncharacterized protein n=1 Tax=Phytophthora infestans TaxID=4787 RepID=A0A833WRH2_PHYIN|nr:hypothetical protein GN244_ATG13283 [Phytophthora infestans]